MLLAKFDRKKKREMQREVSGLGGSGGCDACAEGGRRPWVSVPGCHQGLPGAVPALTEGDHKAEAEGEAN